MKLQRNGEMVRKREKVFLGLANGGRKRVSGGDFYGNEENCKYIYFYK